MRDAYQTGAGDGAASEDTMKTWKAPKFVEIACSFEINLYASAVL